VPEFLNLKPASIHREIRDTLFGDLPLERLVRSRPEVQLAEPWESFRSTKTLIDSGDHEAAKQILHKILETPKLESRVCLQAWHILRELGEEPPEGERKDVLGVVVEVGMRQGLDLLAGYSDYGARYFDFSGAGILWDHPDDSLNDSINDLLAKGTDVVQAIGPWKHIRPPGPNRGQARINLLTRSGLHLGQGPKEALTQDPMGGAILSSAFRLMGRLIDLKKK